MSLVEILAEARATLAGAASARGVQIDLEVDEDAAGHLDRSLLRRAVENLLSNAIRVSQAGDRTELRGRWEGERLVVEVADRGPGLSKIQKRRAVEKFARGQAGHGFGLGLHLVKLVAEAHAGELSLRDREGGGLVVSLSLEPGAA